MCCQSNRCEGNLSNLGYDEELRAERAYTAELYARLDGERAQAAARFRAALGKPGSRWSSATPTCASGRARRHG